MRMSVTTKGIDWDRVKPENFDTLAAEVEAAAAGCGSAGQVVEESGRSWYTRRVYHPAYTTEDGRTFCTECARRRLEELKGHPGLSDALGTSRAARFGAWVREGVAA